MWKHTQLLQAPPCGGLLLFSCLVLSGMVASVVDAQTPKMISSPVVPGIPLGIPISTEIVLTSNTTTHIGDCAPGTPVTLSLYGTSGRAAIGVEAPAGDKGISVVQTNGAVGQIDIAPVAKPDFFAVNDESFEGIPMQYSGLPPTSDGIPIEIQCTAPTAIVVIVNDDVNFVIEASVTESEDGDEIELIGEVAAEAPLDGYTRPGRGQGAGPPVSFSSADNKKIKVNQGGGNGNGNGKGYALVSGVFTTPSGDKVRRSFVRGVKEKQSGSMTPRSVTIDCCDINQDGDIDVRFPGLGKKDEFLRVDARFGIEADGATVEVVDVTASLTQGDFMTVHGGWIRKALQDIGLQDQTEGWSVVLIDVIVYDPKQGYRTVGIKGNVINNGVPPGQAKRALLSRGPTTEEKEITDEMKMGKKPAAQARNGQNKNLRRELSGIHKKILVHGYCVNYASGNPNPFPINQFSNSIAFSSGTTNNNWSHDEFAQRFVAFANNNNIHGCGCIAHSQGGAACLHTYTYYWSCLDNAAASGAGIGSRLIQSVGTPYQGTPLAGNLAVLGEIFGAGCGENTDMTTSGADTWLSGIPTWARQQVNYYTTSFKDNWWSVDYCHLATDLFLSDPDDGTVEKHRGQLAWGVNRGHKEGWCHTTGMSDPSHTQDSSRNSEMNTNSKW